jgi:hypothetical protein
MASGSDGGQPVRFGPENRGGSERNSKADGGHEWHAVQAAWKDTSRGDARRITAVRAEQTRQYNGEESGAADAEVAGSRHHHRQEDALSRDECAFAC